MAPTPIPGEDTSLKRERLTTGTLTSIVETALKFAGAVAVFGYLSLRAHLNFLGIPMTRSLGTERYLMEAGAAIYYAAMYVATFGGPVILRVLVICTGVWLLSRLLPQRLRHWGRACGMGGRLAHCCGTHWCPLLLLTAYLFFCKAVLDAIRPLAEKSVIGNLATVPVETGGSLFVLLILVCCVGYAACRSIPRLFRVDARAGADLVTRGLWIVTGVVVVLVALLIPIVFGCCVRAADYAQVGLLVERIQSDKTPGDKTLDTTCGLLVFETDSQLFLWRMVAASAAPGTGATGAVDVIPRTQVRQMRVGPAKDLRHAIKTFKETEKIDDLCPQTGGQS